MEKIILGNKTSKVAPAITQANSLADGDGVRLGFVETNNDSLIDYFDKWETLVFCFNLLIFLKIKIYLNLIRNYHKKLKIISQSSKQFFFKILTFKCFKVKH